MTAAAFYVIQLQGSFGFFYLMYLSTLILGAGEFVAVTRCLLGKTSHEARGGCSQRNFSEALRAIVLLCCLQRLATSLLLSVPAQKLRAR